MRELRAKKMKIHRLATPKLQEFVFPYLGKAIEIGHVFIWIILPVFPVVEVHAEPVELHQKQEFI